MGGGTGGGFKGTKGDKTNRWGVGSAESSYHNAITHYRKHGSEIGAKNFDDYLRKANAFKDTVLNKNIKGKLVSGYTSDVYRYSYNGKYIDLQRLSDGNYQIISHGKR